MSLGSGGGHSLRLYVLSGKAPFITASMVAIPIQAVNVPPPALQPKTIFRIDTGDARIEDAAFSNGKIWLSFNDGCRIANDTQSRSCLGLIELDTKNDKVIQDFDVGAVASYFYYPALSIDGAGSLDVVYGYSSAKVYPSLYVSGQTEGGVHNTLSQPVNLTLGGAVERTPRYVDYFGVTDDPSLPSTFWVAGEYNPSSPFKVEYWSTFIGNFTTASPTSTSTSSPHSDQR